MFFNLKTWFFNWNIDLQDENLGFSIEILGFSRICDKWLPYYCAMRYVEENISRFFFKKNILWTNVLLIDKSDKRYRTAFIMSFIMKKKINYLDLADKDSSTIL